ncbi:hypothetical protein GCM10017774_46630 [Lentzea cavernae]|uniref:Uncharacterized protein n=1 Tax=Lentzea cavernae TaxID=2020703 RepID=A0ABQ3MNK1_9PSEU|nr:hypothetical protein GCM10017774_46630 [Lentzea cavernae]
MLDDVDGGGVVLDAVEDEVEDDVGGSVWGGGVLSVSVLVGFAGSVVSCGWSGVPGFAWSCGGAACLRSWLDTAFGAPEPEDTVTTTVLVLPSGATLVMVCTTSAAVRSGAASRPDAASMDATVANRVATTTPPAASITAVPMRFFGWAGSVGDCG